MPIPVISLDDRSFDDLVAEARERMQRHVPELTQFAEGDPAHALTDLMAWMAETVIYRANLIPERQRQAFLNLLQLPLRPAIPATGLVCIDARPWRKSLELPSILSAESAIKAGDNTFTTMGEVQATPLNMHVMIKEEMDDRLLEQLGISPEHLAEMYHTRVSSFRPRTLKPGIDKLDLQHSLDKSFYLLMSLPKADLVEHADKLREALLGKILNIGLAPLDDIPADLQGSTGARELRWEIAWQEKPGDDTRYFALEVIDDSSLGGRRSGVARLRLPRSLKVMQSQFPTDPKQAGFNNRPPEQPTGVKPEQVLFWLRLSAPQEESFQLGYLGINAVEVIGQGVIRDSVLGIGTHYPNQSFALQHAQVDAGSLQIEVSQHGNFSTWHQVDHFADAHPDSEIYRFDPATGVVQFGDGIRGKRPPLKSRIRAVYYRYGGGSAGNLAPGILKQLSGGSTRYALRHEWPCKGGRDAENISEAEQRIPAHLNHRNRAVTKEDFAELARSNPVNPVARAVTVSGLLPSASLAAARFNVPGVVSVFVLPPAEPALGTAPRPSAGLLRDVYNYLDQRKLLGTELYVLSPQFIPVAISLSLNVVDPGRERETQNQVVDTLLDYLWSLAPGGPVKTGWELGRDLSINELISAAARVPGVLAINGLRLFHQSTSNQDWIEIKQGVLTLAPYQLPELMEVKTQIELSSQTPDTPDIANPDSQQGGSTDDGSTPVPAPVIPDLC